MTCAGSPNFSCSANAGLVTPANANALLPATAVVHSSNQGGPVILPYLSYWTDLGSAAGTLSLRIDSVNTSNLTLTTKATTAAQIPCVVDNYWGDYDQMVVQKRALPRSSWFAQALIRRAPYATQMAIPNTYRLSR